MKLDDFVLMVSEVVTNAVRHGSPEADGNIGLRLEGDQDALRVIVTDGGEDFASDPASVEDAKNGHFGLLFVDRLADRWGLSLDGKTAVWLEVDNPQAIDGTRLTSAVECAAAGEYLQT
jgi:anti-sigma regulatory factor (Ser/Thr protein kinase)